MPAVPPILPCMALAEVDSSELLLSISSSLFSSAMCEPIVASSFACLGMTRLLMT